MKIVDVVATPPIGPHEWALVRIDTDEGLSGYGEVSLFKRVHRDDVTQVKQLLVGRRPHDVEPLLAPLMNAFHPGRNPDFVHAVEMALLDLLGKTLGVPVHTLLGGKYRERIRMYADSHAGVHWTPDGIAARIREVEETGRFLDCYTPGAYAAQARAVVAQGYTAVKFDIDFPTPHKHDRYDRSISPAELKGIVDASFAIREAIGPEVDLAIDLHAAYNLADALRIAYELEPLNLMWLEDPLPPGNQEAMQKLCEKARVPICTGESLVGREAFRNLITRQAADVIQPDIPHSCGMRDLKKIADLAELYLVSIAPHNMTSPIATMAAVHACAAVSNFLALENHCLAIPWWNDCVEGGEPIIVDGHITVPEAPGLGVTPNEAVLAEHCQGELWSIRG